MMRVADYIADRIYKLGVKEVFMVSGGGMMFLSDGLAKHPRLKAVCNHHEQASAMAAESYAKYNGNIGAAYLTTGCGATNAITGLLGAWQDNVPCIFISGQSKRKETIRNSGLPLRQFGVQEADIVSIVRPITKYAEMVNDPKQIAYHIDKAVYLAKSGRPGPVWLDIPLDVQGAVIDADKLPRFSEDQLKKDYKEDPSDDEMKKVHELITNSKRPVILAGGGIRLAGAIKEFAHYVESSGIPVVASRLGVGLIPTAHPLFIGKIGNKGDRAGNFAVQNADLVIAIGSRLSVSSTGHEYATFAREAKIVVVDIDPVEHKKNTVRIDVFINADAKRFINKLKTVDKPGLKKWADKCLSWKKKWPIYIPSYKNDRKGINTYFFIETLSDLLKKDSVVIADAGSTSYVIAQGIKLKNDQRYITSSAQGEMGYTVPACIGVCFAKNKHEVFGITGDGSFQMNIQELQTIVHHKLPIKLFIWNNGGYLSIRATQTKFFDGRLIGTDESSGVSFPSTKKIAQAYGIRYLSVKRAGELEKTIKTMMKYDSPVICEVFCEKDQEVIPTVSSLRKDDGTMVSKPLEDMYPFLPREEFNKEMIIKPLKE
jgi:acetolactate synthase-1/2/3 large subunit